MEIKGEIYEHFPIFGSSNIASIAHNMKEGDDAKMVVFFKHGAAYLYYKVSVDTCNLIKNDEVSVGKKFIELVKKNPERYPFEALPA